MGGYTIRAAASDSDKDAVYRGRHHVYVAEMGAMSPRPDGRIRDAFDDSPDTLNLVICDDAGRIVGGARFVADAGHGTPADDTFDFDPFLPAGSQRGAGSMLWVLPEARGIPGLIGDMMAAGLEWSAARGLTHILATVNPPVAARFARVGYRAVGEPFVHGLDRLPVQPMILDVAEQRPRRPT